MTAAELANLIATLTAKPEPEDSTVQQRRERIAGLERFLPTPADASVRPVSADGVPCEWVAAPGAAHDRAILYLHGGGYVIGSIGTHRTLGYNLSKASGAQVLMVDYRLAPEHPYPAALDDAVTAWRWMVKQGAKPARSAIAGDSAGGGLAVGATLKLRDEREALPSCAFLISPWTDLTASGASIAANVAVDPTVKVPFLHRFAGLYMNGGDLRTPYASPLFADLRGLPPTLIHVGSVEVLLDDSTKLAERARQAGIEVECEIWPQMPHIWHIFAPMLSEGREALAKGGAFIRKRTGG